jgi:glycosyltransferase involved in cell wall biosynthesis
MNPACFRILIATFHSGGALLAELAAADWIRLFSFEKRSRWNTLYFFWNLYRLVKQFKPDIIHGYMDEANLASLVIGKLTGAKVVLGLRASRLAFRWRDPIPSMVFRLCAWLSRYADLVICNSEAGKRYHLQQGFNCRNTLVISNGIDGDRFRPDRAARLRIRDQLGIQPGILLIGMVARLDPMKDHQTFLHAASNLCRRREDVRFICVGEGANPYGGELGALVHQLGMESRIIWIRKFQDMPALYNAFDIVTLSSHSEGFPNVIGEAMACGIPCVAADVGDVRDIVAATGRVIPAHDPQAMLEAWHQLLSLGENGRRE